MDFKAGLLSAEWSDTLPEIGHCQVGGLQRTRKRQNGREALRTAACPPKQPRFHAEIDGRGDELQARIDPAAVRIVQHLDAWRERVEKCLPVNGKIFADMLEPSQKGLEPLRRQALIWRQLLSGDKEPEAYMDRGERTRFAARWRGGSGITTGVATARGCSSSPARER